MPAEGIHLTALREATASERLGADVRRRLVRHDDAARLGAILADLPYFDRYAGEVLRYVTGRPARPSPWGAAIHEGGAVALLGTLLRVARDERDETLAAIALGLASHCAIDRALHPLINALARRHQGGPTHDASHREVEKFQSICFHERYVGRDTMGTPAITSLLTIGLTRHLDDQRLEIVRRAWETALERAPTLAELRRMMTGYRTHAWLLGTPLGARVAPPAAKDAARPRYLVGAWGSFEAALASAIDRSVAVLGAAGAVLDADERDASRAAAELDRLLPPGTIDPQGDAVDLERPFALDPSLVADHSAVSTMLS